MCIHIHVCCPPPAEAVLLLEARILSAQEFLESQVLPTRVCRLTVRCQASRSQGQNIRSETMMSSHSISCPINKEQPTRPGSLTRDPEKLSRKMYLKCLNEILAMDKMKSVVLLDFCCSTTHLLGSARLGAGENGQTQSLLTGTEKNRDVSVFFPQF